MLPNVATSTTPDDLPSHATGIGRTTLSSPICLAMVFPDSLTHSSLAVFARFFASSKVYLPVNRVTTCLCRSERFTNRLTHTAADDDCAERMAAKATARRRGFMAGMGASVDILRNLQRHGAVHSHCDGAMDAVCHHDLDGC